MKYTLAALALASLSVAAPLQSGKFVEGTPEGHRPGSYVPGWNPLGRREALQSGKFVEGTPEGHRPGSYVPGWSPGGISNPVIGRLTTRDALQSGKFVEGTPEGHRPGSYVPVSLYHYALNVCRSNLRTGLVSKRHL